MQVVNAKVATPEFTVSAMVQAQLDEARSALGNVLLKTGDVVKSYANTMNHAFGFGWWDAKGAVKKSVKVEHAKYIEMCTNTLKWSRSNTDKQWSEIKDLAGRVKAPKVSGTKTVDQLNVDNMITILNRIENADSESAPISHKVFNMLIEVADLMGIDVTPYGKDVPEDDEDYPEEFDELNDKL